MVGMGVPPLLLRCTAILMLPWAGLQVCAFLKSLATALSHLFLHHPFLVHSGHCRPQGYGVIAHRVSLSCGVKRKQALGGRGVGLEVGTSRVLSVIGSGLAEARAFRRLQTKSGPSRESDEGCARM